MLSIQYVLVFHATRYIFVTAGEVGHNTVSSSSGNYIGYRLRIETGTERMSIVDIFNIIPKVRDTDIHLKVDEEQMEDHTRK